MPIFIYICVCICVCNLNTIKLEDKSNELQIDCDSRDASTASWLGQYNSKM